VAANVVPAAGEASSAPSNPSPGFEGALRGAETEEKGIRERWEKERKERAGRDGRTPPPQNGFLFTTLHVHERCDGWLC